MIRRAVLFLALFSSVANAFAISTIAGEEFYGTWSTASSALHPDRQILELSPVGGRWIQRDDLGNDKVLVLDASDISFNDDLLIIDYKKPEEVFRLKLVLVAGKFAIIREFLVRSICTMMKAKVCRYTMDCLCRLKAALIKFRHRPFGHFSPRQAPKK